MQSECEAGVPNLTHTDTSPFDGEPDRHASCRFWFSAGARKQLNATGQSNRRSASKCRGHLFKLPSSLVGMTQVESAARAHGSPHLRAG